MQVGTALCAPKGFGSLAAKDTYYLVASTADPHRVLLARFWWSNSEGGSGKGVDLLSFARNVFEQAVADAKLVELAAATKMPPWHDQLLGKDLQAEAILRPASMAHVDHWMALLKPAIAIFDEIVVAKDPIKLINQLARAEKQNTGRYRFQLLTYMLFGQDHCVLIPQSYRSGCYKRADLPPGRKLGRPSKSKGCDFGARLSEHEKARVVDGYRKHKQRGVTRKKLYAIVMNRDFGCKSKGEKWRTLIHPEGKPFPTYGQFNYLLIKNLGLEQLQIDRYGRERVRNKIKGNKGSFTECVANVMERVEADGYTTATHPVGMRGELLPKLTVVRIICCASGLPVGIGFSLGGETAEAYNMARFCAAIDKRRFCGLFGLQIEPHFWPSIGLANLLIVDRGAGATIDLTETPVRELSPAYSGQSKALVESSHPRADKFSGQPTYLTRSASPARLCAEEICRLLIDADTSERKRTPEMIASGIRGTSLGIWEYLDIRARVKRPSDASALPHRTGWLRKKQNRRGSRKTAARMWCGHTKCGSL